jgi:hypothetical protein
MICISGRHVICNLIDEVINTLLYITEFMNSFWQGFPNCQDCRLEEGAGHIDILHFCQHVLYSQIQDQNFIDTKNPYMNTAF